MEKTVFYWTCLVKEGKDFGDFNVFIRANKPRGKFYVTESSEEIGFLHLWHYFDLHDKKHNVIRSCDFETFCGHDRGPKLRSFVKKMILNGIGGKYSN